MKRASLLLNYKLIHVNTIPHMILRAQKGRYLWDGNGMRRFAKLGSLVWNLIPVLELIKVDLRSEGRRWKKAQNHRFQYFAAVVLGWWNKMMKKM